MRNLKISKILMMLIAIFALSLIFGSNRAEASTKSIAFDATYYADTNPDVKAAFGYDETLLKNHWEKYGVSEGRSASPAFDVKYYVESNPDLGEAFGRDYMAAYNHFMNYGLAEGRKTSIVFDVNTYLNLNEDVKVAFGTNYKKVFEHFINYGISEGRNSSIVFNVKYYLNSNNDLKSAFKTNYLAAYEHFANYGMAEGRIASPVFSVKYYVDNNIDVKLSYKTDYKAAFQQFLNYGIKEGRKGISTFDVKYYLSHNNDLQLAFWNNYKSAFEHYINYGISENRIAVDNSPISDNIEKPLSKISNEELKNWLVYITNIVDDDGFFTEEEEFIDVAILMGKDNGWLSGDEYKVEDVEKIVNSISEKSVKNYSGTIYESQSGSIPEGINKYAKITKGNTEYFVQSYSWEPKSTILTDIELQHISYSEGIYTVTYVYGGERTIEEWPYYETKVTFKLDENNGYSKFKLISYEKPEKLAG